MQTLLLCLKLFVPLTRNPLLVWRAPHLPRYGLFTIRRNDVAAVHNIRTRASL